MFWVRKASRVVLESSVALYHIYIFVTHNNIQPTALKKNENELLFDRRLINIGPHMEKGSHLLAIISDSKSSRAYYFDFYGIVPLVPDILAFIRRFCTVVDCNKRQLQSLTGNIWGKYCCLFALYTDRW